MGRAAAIAILLIGLPLLAQQPPLRTEQQALAAWRDYDYAAAENLYRQAIAANPHSGEAHAGLIRTLLDEEKTAEARTAAQAAEQNASGSPAVQAALGDLSYRDGEVEEAEKHYRAALAKDDHSARGWFGVSEVAEITSNYRTAKNAVLKAHELDPDDPEIYESWASRLPRMERRRAIERLVDHPGHLAPDRLSILQSKLAWLIVLGNKTAWKLVSTTESARIKLDHVVTSGAPQIGRIAGPPRTAGVAIHVRLNNKKTVSLLLDTGASGIVLHRRVAGKADIRQVYDIATRGIGDEKAAIGYLGWAGDVKIGSIEFENVPVTVLEGNFAEGTDGLIGIDVFEHFLISLDIQKSELELAALPAVPAEDRDENDLTDRYIAPSMQQYDRILHVGPHILVPTSIDRQKPGLFFFDTGAFDSQVDPAYVAKSKVVPTRNLAVRGLSGSVRDVYVAENVEIQFGHFVQDNFRMVAISMDKLSEGEGVAVTGILGFPLLSQFRLTIDYRDGLVLFDYKGTKH